MIKEELKKAVLNFAITTAVILFGIITFVYSFHGMSYLLEMFTDDKALVSTIAFTSTGAIVINFALNFTPVLLNIMRRGKK